MTRREEILTTLLERFVELCDPMQSGNESGDTGLRLMPSTYNESVRELERLLNRMRAERPKQYRHVRFRYIERTQVLRDMQVERKTKKGKTVKLTERRLVDVYPAWVRPKTVAKGVEWLADQWNLSHEPFLPEELRVAA